MSKSSLSKQTSDLDPAADPAPSPDSSPAAPTILRYTEDYRRKLFTLGRDSLFYYCKYILGMKDMTEDLHWDYCRVLSGPWTRLLVAMARGTLKSSVGTVGFASHQSIYVPDHATKLVEKSSQNAYRNHFTPIYELFTESERSDFLYWLYGPDGGESSADMQRIPDSFAGWNANQIVFKKKSSLTLAALTYGGVKTAYEGWHGDLVLGDDLEGSDEDKKDAADASADAWHFVENRAIPLLKNPGTGRILIIGTSHGDDPVIHKIREKEEKFRTENPGQKVWNIFWKPLLGSDNKCIWSKRFTPKVVAGLKLNPELWEKQYQLRKTFSGSHAFDMDIVESQAYQKVPPLIRYPRRLYNLDNLDDNGYPEIVNETCYVHPYHLRAFMHCDPKHKKGPRWSNAQAAIAVVGTYHDRNAFVLDTWTGDVGLEEYAEKVYELYRRWAPLIVTMESVGAQAWFWDYARLLEQTKYQHILSFPRPGIGYKDPGSSIQKLPPLTRRLVESGSHNENKEVTIVTQLQSWFNFGALHVGDHQDFLHDCIRRFPDSSAHKDLLDCLAQGPPVWTFPTSPEDIRRRNLITGRQRLMAESDPVTGYIQAFPQPQVP